jgi:acetoin utilization protein AcuB
MTPVKVRDVMTKDPVTITSGLPVDVAIETMRSNRVRRLPVVSETNRVVGILTLYDAMIATRKSGDWMSELVEPMPVVGDAMTANVITIGPDESVAQAARLMNGHRVGALPVVENMRLIGIVTESDLFRVLADMLEPGQS